MTSTGELQRQMVAAVWVGDPDRVALLLEQDSSLVHARDPFGRTLVEISANQVLDRTPQFRDIVIQLVDAGAACDLFTAARAGLFDYVTRLIAESPGLAHAVDALGRTAMQRAALINGECAACDAVVDALDRQGTPMDMFTACVFGRPAIVAGAVERSPSLVDTYLQGGTPLLWAVRPRRNQSAAPMIVATLLNAGAALDVRDTEGDENTPLHYAASWADQAELARLLLRAGADIDLMNANGKTSHDLAVERDHHACAQLLEAAASQREGLFERR